MKKTIVTIFLAIFMQTNILHAQWQGAGTQQDPYKIFTLADLDSIRTNEANFSSYQNIHFELQNDITDSVTESIAGEFHGYFHGKGHVICLNLIDTDFSNNNFIYSLYGYVDSITFNGAFLADYSLFVGIYETGVLSDITLVLHVVTTHEISLDPVVVEHDCQLLNMNNEGIIKNCINNSDINVSAAIDTTSITMINLFSSTNQGKILNCINNGNINITTNTLNNLFIYIFSFINTTVPEMPDGGYIGNCINNGNININGIADYSEVSVFSYVNGGSIVNCINNGYITAKQTDVCGIFAAYNGYLVSNCLNTGSLIGEEIAGGIVGELWCQKYYGYAAPVVINCMNTGNIIGNSEVGGIIGKFNCHMGICAVIKNNLNLHKTSGYAIFGDTASTFTQILELENNYYDKQMVTQQATVIGDIVGVSEGKLTTQLIGTSPELQTMLGDGWSYAEGRYPIPLGLENDSMALVAATPVYLHFETEEEYNHVDSVSRNFTVGLENNVNWEEANGRVSFSDENVTLLSMGMENLTVSLGDYSKNVRINIVDIETSAPIQTIENGISVYPNPASDFINLSLNGVKADKVEIYDITGKIISSQLLVTEHNQIYIKNLKSGMYLLKIYNKNQNVTTFRFAKS
jgi:hypothetical protein